MKSTKPLVLGILVALNAAPLWAQSQPAALPSILDSKRAARPKIAEPQTPVTEILETRPSESIEQSLDRIENERIIRLRTAVPYEPPRPATPNIRDTRRKRDPGPAAATLPEAPVEQAVPLVITTPVVDVPVPISPAVIEPPATAAPAASAAPPVVAVPSIVPGNINRPKRSPEPVKEDTRSIPLREAEALNVPDVNIPLIGFREKYAVPEEPALAPATDPAASAATVAEPQSNPEPRMDAPVNQAIGAEAPVTADAPVVTEGPLLQSPPVSLEVKAASNIVEVFARARVNSPTFRAAEATRDANLTESTIAKLAFVPTGNIALTQFELEDSTRKVFRVGVPLFSLAALAKFREADPLEIQAYANFRVQENTLANEVFRVTSSLVRASEQERLNQANIDTLQQQVRFAEQAYREGQGTITDLRDTQVRLNQALASRIAAVSQRVSAEQEYRNLVGEPPSRQALQMSAGFKDIQIETYDAYLQKAMQGNPSYIASTQALKISELGILRSRGGALPTVGLTALASERNGRRTDNVGFSVNIPLGVQDHLAVSVAKDKHRAQTETYRGIEQNLRLMIQQLQSQSASGRIEVAVRTDAISSAELSVQANQKSYLGGVRTQIEVLNSIQTLFDTQLQQINSRLTLAQNVLKLELESGAEPTDALLKVQTLLF